MGYLFSESFERQSGLRGARHLVEMTLAPPEKTFYRRDGARATHALDHRVACAPNARLSVQVHWVSKWSQPYSTIASGPWEVD